MRSPRCAVCNLRSFVSFGTSLGVLLPPNPFLTKKFHHLRLLGKAQVVQCQIAPQLPPPNASLESGACYLTIRLFASLSCLLGSVGRAGSLCCALPSNQNWSRRRNARCRYLFLQTSGSSQQTLPGVDGDFAVLTQPVVQGIMEPSWRHLSPLSPACQIDTCSSPRRKCD